MQKLVLIAVVLFLVLASCSDGDGDDQAAPDTTSASGSDTVESATEEGAVQRQPVGASSYFSINEVGLGPDGYVSLTNFTEVPVTTDGLYLCQRPAYVALPDVTVEPGETVRVTVGDGDGLENVIMTEAALGDLRPEDGEIALYTSDSFSDPAAMIVYLEWGSTPHGRTDVAIEAGLWPEGSFAPTSPTATRLYRVEDSGLWLFEPNN